MIQPAAAKAKGPRPSKASSTARPLEIEEPLNLYFFHPLSRGLVRLLMPTGITPRLM